MNPWIFFAYALGLVTLPLIGGVAWLSASAFLPSRRWLGCGTCTFWTSSQVPIVRHLQWARHRAWGILRPAAHAKYGRLHPPRREPEDRDTIPTDLLLAGLTEDNA